MNILNFIISVVSQLSSKKDSRCLSETRTFVSFILLLNVLTVLGVFNVNQLIILILFLTVFIINRIILSKFYQDDEIEKLRTVIVNKSFNERLLKTILVILYVVISFILFVEFTFGQRTEFY